jgi:hypothetical protein
MRAGFSSRVAAISAVTQTGAAFTDMSELRNWLREDTVAARAIDPDWPSTESHGLWLQFTQSLAPVRRRQWHKSVATLAVRWDASGATRGTPVRLYNDDRGTRVLSADFTPLGRLETPINAKRLGLVKAMVAVDEHYLDVVYLGPNDLTAGS